MIGKMYDIYNKEDECYIKTGCTLQAVIEPNFALSDDEVRKYFGIDEGHRYWEFNHRPFSIKRFVFDKCVIPDNPRYVFRPCEDVVI